MVTMPTPNLPHRYLKTFEAARLLGLSERTLEKHRCKGTGPSFIKLGGRVVYKLDELNAWAEKGVRTSTSDPGKARIQPTKSYPQPSTPR
jgi:predicted DNA-binding transcriptional regulator AlpA